MENQNKEEIAAIISDPKPVKEKELYRNTPYTVIEHYSLRTLDDSKRPIRITKRTQTINHAVNANVTYTDRGQVYTYETAKTSVSIKISDALTNSRNKENKKILMLILIKAFEQALHNGKLTSKIISFHLSELVDLGLYKNLRTARAGIEGAWSALSGLSYDYKDKKRKRSGFRTYITGGDIKMNRVYIMLNDYADWQIIASKYIQTPLYYFRASNRAADLILSIFYIMRQRTAQIAEKGFFTIQLDTLQKDLHLPNADPGAGGHPGRDTVEPLKAAIEEVMRLQKEAGARDLTLTLEADSDSTHAAALIDCGYLRVNVAPGALRDRVMKIAQLTAEKTAHALERKERREDIAAGKKMRKERARQTAPDTPAEACKKEI